jgi:hypothetical protein
MSEYKPQAQNVSLKTFRATDLDDFMEWATDIEVVLHKPKI